MFDGGKVPPRGGGSDDFNRAKVKGGDLLQIVARGGVDIVCLNLPLP